MDFAIAQMTADGHCVRDICRAHQVSLPSVLAVMRRRGIKRVKNPPLTTAEYGLILSALEFDATPPRRVALTWGMRTIDVRAIALGEWEHLPDEYKGRADLAAKPSRVCAFDDQLTLSPLVMGAMRGGRILTEITGRAPPQMSSPNECGFTGVYRGFAANPRLRGMVLTECRDHGVWGDDPNPTEVWIIANRFGLPYASVWEISVALGNDAGLDVRPTARADLSSLTFEALGESELNMLEGIRKEVLLRPSFCRSLKDMFDDGSFGWLDVGFPQYQIPERCVIPGLHGRTFCADENGDVFRLGRRISTAPMLVRLNEKGACEVRVRDNWLELDILVCSAFHGIQKAEYRVMHYTEKRDCRPSQMGWTSIERRRAPQ